jgi:hypothetical protein
MLLMIIFLLISWILLHLYFDLKHQTLSSSFHLIPSSSFVSLSFAISPTFPLLLFPSYLPIVLIWCFSSFLHLHMKSISAFLFSKYCWSVYCFSNAKHYMTICRRLLYMTPCHDSFKISHIELYNARTISWKMPNMQLYLLLDQFNVVIMLSQSSWTYIL